MNDEPNWEDLVYAVVRDVASLQDTFTFDDVKRACYVRGIHDNPRPNSWGAVAHACARSRIIVKTGQYVPGHNPKSHAAVIAVWRRGAA